MFYLRRIGPRVADINFAAEFFQPVHHIHRMTVADIGAVFLECDPQLQYLCSVDPAVFLDHQLDDFSGDIVAHAVVDAASGEDHLGQIAQGLSFVGQVVGIDADAMTADQAGSLQHYAEHIKSHAFENTMQNLTKASTAMKPE